MSVELPYCLGCPAWKIAGWRGGIFPESARPDDFLNLYSQLFNTVEGNSTFYGLPKLETTKRWAGEVESGFKFCFKVPRDVSHGPGLMRNMDLLQAFWKLLEVVADRAVLGSTFLQLHASFGPERLPELTLFCEQWPNAFPLAIEVRHPSFFKGGDDEKRLNTFISERGHDRVIFDSRALFHASPDDEVEAKSQGRKPNLPVRWITCGKRPMLRFVGRNQIEKVDPWLKEAAHVVAGWISEGLHPYVFMHTPDDVFAPLLCEKFHAMLRRELPDIPEFDVMRISGDSQMELF